MTETYNDKIRVKFSFKDTEKTDQGYVSMIWQDCYSVPLVGDRVKFRETSSKFVITERYWLSKKRGYLFWTINRNERLNFIE